MFPPTRPPSLLSHYPNEKFRRTAGAKVNCCEQFLKLLYYSGALLNREKREFVLRQVASRRLKWHNLLRAAPNQAGRLTGIWVRQRRPPQFSQLQKMLIFKQSFMLTSRRTSRQRCDFCQIRWLNSIGVFGMPWCCPRCCVQFSNASPRRCQAHPSSHRLRRIQLPVLCTQKVSWAHDSDLPS